MFVRTASLACVLALAAILLPSVANASIGLPAIIRFDLSTGGSFDIELYDSTPLTKANFMKYVNDGRYDNSFFHSLVPGSVLQGGGYYWTGPSTYSTVPTYGTVPNEASTLRPNNMWTVAMAKVPNAPDSATSQWFINLADNGGPPNNLDSENGGYTTFGNVVAGFDTLSAIAGYPAWNASSIDAAWDSLPLIPAFDNTRPVYESDFVTITNAYEIAPEPATMALLAMGGGLAILGRRRGRK